MNTPMSRISCPNNENPEKFLFSKFFGNNFLGFSLLGHKTLDIGVFIYLMGSPDCKDLKKYMWEGYFWGT